VDKKPDLFSEWKYCFSPTVHDGGLFSFLAGAYFEIENIFYA